MRTSYCRLKTILLLIFSSVFVIHLQASHVLEGDLSYKCLGGNNYEIRLVLSKSCISIGAPSIAYANVESMSCGMSNSVALSEISFGEISSICPASLPNSECNGGTLVGYEEHVYTGQIYLPPCTDWLMYYSFCCRSPVITNSVNVSSYPLYAEATLNNVAAPCNSSPMFTINRHLLVLGLSNELNFGGWDPDGDSIAFSLADPLGGTGIPIPFVVPFSASYPMATIPANNFGFDATVGQVSFHPTPSQVALLKVKAEEYRQGTLIGSSFVDKVVYIINNYPTDSMHVYQPPLPGSVSGGTMNGQVIETNAGQTLSFNFEVTDPDTSTLSMTTNISTTIPGATLTTTGTNPIQFSFNWQPTTADEGFRYFAVTVMDNFCPINKYLDIGFLIKVKPYSCNLNAAFQYTTQADSTGTLVNFIDNSTPAGNYNYFWDFGDGSFDTQANPTHYYSDSTSIDSLKSYEVCLTVNDGGGCVSAYCDSLTVFVNPDGGITVEVEEPIIGHQFTIFPNPVLATATISLESDELLTGTLSVFNVGGIQLLKQEIQIQQGEQTLELPTNQLEAGVYLVVLKTDKGTAVNRLVKL